MKRVFIYNTIVVLLALDYNQAHEVGEYYRIRGDYYCGMVNATVDALPLKGELATSKLKEVKCTYRQSVDNDAAGNYEVTAVYQAEDGTAQICRWNYHKVYATNSVEVNSMTCGVSEDCENRY